MEYGLPKVVEINGVDYEIRYDYRVILEIFEMLSDPELDNEDKAAALLQMFYVDSMEHLSWEECEEAIKKCIAWINIDTGWGGEEEIKQKKSLQLVYWQKDYPLIVSPVNHVLGYDIRSVPYDLEANTGGVHWWSFVAAYFEIGDCLFAQIVSLRKKLAEGKKLDKSDREFYKKNYNLINVKAQHTEAEKALLKEWI